MRHLAIPLFLLAASATAQTLVVPSVAAAADGNSSTTWPFDVAAGRFLYTYDSSHFTSNGVTFPILITGIRWRANASTATWTGASFPVTLDLSTAPGDYTAMVTTFDSNHGPDRTQVFNGTMTVAPGSSTTGTPGPFYTGLTFPAFLYDPTQGDLVIDTVHSGGVPANTPTPDAVSTAGLALARRVTTTTNPPPATGTLGTTDFANVLEFTYTPASGLYAGFSANVTTGPSPLSVTFTDQTFTSAPGGITGWSWDFDGDNVPDSSVQNPTFVYTSCGTYNVSLTVTDGVHAPSTLVRTAYVTTDNIAAGFTATVIGPLTVQFTDTSNMAATSWAWDLDGDNITDSTAQNPVWVYPNANPVNVRLTVTRLCSAPSTLTRSIVPLQSISQNTTAGNGLSSGATVFYDLGITNPAGVSINSFDVIASVANTAFTIDIFVTPGTYLGV
ncbi:MAG: PKD domain-containing protein, partial [Planctomycetes bacterium]|nr:PKD domain-containing protein [Planctomycetota bacterium]